MVKVSQEALNDLNELKSRKEFLERIKEFSKQAFGYFLNELYNLTIEQQAHILWNINAEIRRVKGL